MISLKQHDSSQYAPRTEHNARQGLTIAYAVDHNTAGERLTQRCAAGRIVKISPDTWLSNRFSLVTRIIHKMEELDTTVINFAGNGIYTWLANGYTQRDVNSVVESILERVIHKGNVTKVVSGGQSGTDIAGLIAAARLGVPCEGMWPKGFKMRFGDGIDVYHTKEQIMEILNQYA